MSQSTPPVFVALLFFFVVGAARVPSAEAPTEQIKSTVNKAVAVLKNASLRPGGKTGERRDRLRKILLARFDFPEMAKRSLGSNWRQRTPQEQDEFVRLFTELLERAYVDNIESYTDEKFVCVDEKLDGNYAEVNSKIVKTQGEEFTINYKTHLIGAEWKVYDVVIENISLVNNYRSQFNRVIANSSYDEPLCRMKDKRSDQSPSKK